MADNENRDFHTYALVLWRPLVNRFFRRVQSIFHILVKEKIFLLGIVVLCFVALSGGLVYFAEVSSKSNAFFDFFDAIWWAIVTFASVGYGDKVPQMAVGKFIASIMIFFGITLTSILSGTIASIFVDRKLREGRGLEDIKMKKHIVICGWNNNAEKLLSELLAVYGKLKEGIVLINEMSSDDFQSLQSEFPGTELRFVRGDFVNENVLKKASLESARAAIILSDTSQHKEQINADERTILASLAIKSLNQDIVICAELLNQKNEQHLKRANVDNILVYGEFNGYLLAAASQKSGVTQVVKEMLSGTGKNNLLQREIPPSYIGKTFKELSAMFLSEEKGVLVGFLSQDKKMNLDDILSDDSSAIDAFIKKKFQEAEIDLAEEQKEELQIKLNPGSDYTIKDTDIAFIIGKSL
jgi:voltage-gated potassium channel